jgi:hypothetical protein
MLTIDLNYKIYSKFGCINIYKQKLNPSINKRFMVFVVVVILIIVPLGNEISRIGFNNPELDNAESIDFNNNPEISEELQSAIDATMSGFQVGFRENYNSENGVKYSLSGSQMDMQFSESMIQLRIPEYRQNISPVDDPHDNQEQIEYTFVTLDFVGSNPVEPVAENPSASYFNYFYGSDPDKWITNTPYYNNLRYKAIYDNIDLVYSLKDGQLKYDFYVFPGGNYEEIQLRWNGPVNLEQTDDGLQITVSSLFDKKSFVDSNPVNFLASDHDENVFGSFRLIDEYTYGFSMENYDHSEILIIDPLLDFSTFIGGSGNDYGYSIAVDDNGDIYITGYTADHTTDFPTTSGAYNETHNGQNDVFVSKLAANGSILIFSTFLGGSGSDYGYSIAVDDNGDIYITGYAADHTTDFPTTSGAYNETHNGGTDVIVSKLSANGSTLIFSTFLGGLGNDFGYSIAVDDNGDIYITGSTGDSTTDYPTTTGAFDEIHNGDSDVFVSILAANGSTLIFSTFLGGSGNDYGKSLVIDYNGDIYITGYTADDTTDFPTTSGAYNETHNEFYDVFVSKLAAKGSTLIFSTFLGGSGHDYGSSIAVDDNGDVYITGYTADSTTDFPTTTSAFDETHNGGLDVFVSKLSANGSILIFSTFLGGTSNDYGHSLAVDDNGDVYVTGYAGDGTPDFPTTTGAYNETHNGGVDVIVSKLSANGSTMIFSTFLGGSGDDKGNSIAVDANGDIYVAGTTIDSTTDFPSTTGAYDETPNGGADVLVSILKIKPNPPSNFISIAQNKEDGDFILLFWDVPDYRALPITSYKIYRGTSTGNYALLGTVSAPQTDFNDSSVIENQVYYYVVTAINPHGESEYSSEQYAVISSEPTEPQNLLASAGESFVELNWDLPADDGRSSITEYKIYRGTTSGSYAFVFVTTQLEFNDTTVHRNTTYYYVVTAVNNVGESGYSSEVDATIPDVAIPTDTVTIIDTVTNTENSTTTETTTQDHTTTEISTMIITTISDLSSLSEQAENNFQVIAFVSSLLFVTIIIRRKYAKIIG